jgi:aspartate racemase
MIGILGGMGTQAGLDFCNKLAVLNRGKIDQEYPLFVLYNKSNIPGRPESIGTQTKNLSNLNTNKSNKTKYNKVLKSLLEGCKLLEKNKCKFIVIPCNTAHYSPIHNLFLEARNTPGPVPARISEHRYDPFLQVRS